jgi:LAO/AO transport system kinase
MGAENGPSLLQKAQAGDFQAFARFLSWLERTSPREVFVLKDLLTPPAFAFRLGITGPPGAGKSTLTGRLIAHLRHLQLKVGVIAVDPSSPFSNGAILGDRIRYSEHFLDRGVFIRSLGTRGSLGGLSSAAFLMARAFDACAFDVLLIETVGVGQTELDVLHVADQVCVVLVPESGDSIQAMKAGLMEIADIFVVNKADRPGADGLAREIEASIHDGEAGADTRVVKCVASQNIGVNELVDLVLARKAEVEKWTSERQGPARLRAEAKALLRHQWDLDIQKKLTKLNRPEDLLRLF